MYIYKYSCIYIQTHTCRTPAERQEDEFLWFVTKEPVRSRVRQQVHCALWAGASFDTWSDASAESCLSSRCATPRKSMSHVTRVIWLCHTWCNTSVESRLSMRCAVSHMWRSHVTHYDEWYHAYHWVMSHVWMSHVTHGVMQECKIASMIALRCVTHVMCHTCEWWRMWMSHITHIDELHLACQWVMSRVWMKHVTRKSNTASRLWLYCGYVTHVNEACHVYWWSLSYVPMNHVTRMNESCHTWSKARAELRLQLHCAMSHMWMRHVTYIDEPYRTYQSVVSHGRMSRVTHGVKQVQNCVWYDAVPCHKREWVISPCQSVMSRVWMRHLTRANSLIRTSCARAVLPLSVY